MTEANAKTVDGYIRVSRRMGREGAGYIAPVVQREAIERWAKYKGVTIAAWHVDEDESGGTQDRPGLNAAVERATTGQTGGIVSWKIDRFSRFTEGGLADLRRLEDKGARLVFVTEDIDTSGPIGRFVYTIMLAMGEYVLATIKAGWIVAKERALERGAHIGPTPLGYVRNADGTLGVHPERGPIVTEAFAIAARDGLQATVVYLDGLGLTHENGKRKGCRLRWNAFTVGRFLDCPTYLGRVTYGDHVREGAHDALVTRAIFEAANHRVAQEAGERRSPRGDFPLSGVAVCGSCGGHMVGGRGGADKRRVYRCADRCDAPVVVSADPLESYVVDELREAFQHPGFQVGDASPDVDAAVAAVEEAERELDAFASDLTARKVLGERYHSHLTERAEAVEQAEARLHDALAAVERPRIVVPAELWDDLQPAELAEVLRAGLDAVIVARGRGRRPIASRVRVIPKGLHGGAVAGAQDAQEGGL
jgi:DNA invertase Pin-like site-specific DNA recombinase